MFQHHAPENEPGMQEIWKRKTVDFKLLGRKENSGQTTKE